MKRLNKIFAFALPALVAVACTNIDENVEPNGGLVGDTDGISLTVKASSTRTTLGADGKSVAWAESDKVGLFADYVVGEEATALGANAEYTYEAESGEGASFKGSLNYGDEVADSYNFYAYYPYAAGEVTHGAVEGTLPAEQSYDASAEAFDLSAVDFMWGNTTGVAKSGEISIEMKHTFALMQFTLTNSLASAITINSVSVEAEGETLAGNFTANLADGTITFGTTANAIEVTTSNLTIEAGAKGVVKFMMNAVDLTEKDVVVTVTYNTSETFSETFTGRVFAAAGNYNKNITIGEAAPQTDWYVKTDGAGDGSSWEQATTLDNALLQAAAGNTIHVAAGTYVPSTYAQGATESDSNKTFEITKNVTIIGGYPEGATTGAVADAATNATILDGNATAYHVVLVTAVPVEGEKVVIDGFTITNGKAASTGTYVSLVNNKTISDKYGAGLYVECSAAEIVNCKISGNNGNMGAGFCFNNSVVDMHDCEITSNAASANGANLVYSDVTTADAPVVTTITNCVFSGNSSTAAGALYIYSKMAGQSCYVANCEFSSNTTTGRGGAAYVRSAHSDGLDCTFVNCTFSGNSSKSLGSAIDVYGAAKTPCTVNVISCTASANSALNTAANGGCLATETAGTTLNIYNTIVSGNTTNGTVDANVYKKNGTVNYQNVVVGEALYGAAGTVVEGQTFATADLGTYANGVYPIANTSVAWTNGMSAADLYTLGNGLNSTLFTEDVMKKDQKGNSRTGNVMGAYVGN